MLPESVLNTLAGGVIGIASGLAIWIIRDWIEIRRKRSQLIDAIDAAARSCTVPAISSAYTGRTGFFSPAAQFLPTFWRDLPLLGTYTQMLVVSYFSALAESTAGDVPPSKKQLEALEGMSQAVTRLLELERKGKRQDVKAP
jgi:hypothetical protein